MLFGIIPKEGEKWAANANKTFMDITCDKRLCAIVMDITKDQRLAMCLTDTSGAIDMHINDFLVISDLAEFAESAKDVPTQDLEQVNKALDWEVSSDEEEDINESSYKLTSISHNPGAISYQLPNNHMSSHTTHTSSSQLQPPQGMMFSNQSNAQHFNLAGAAPPPLERAYSPSGITSGFDNLHINNPDDQMPSLEVIKKCIVNPSVNRNQQTAMVKPNIQPTPPAGMPPLQPIPTSSQPQHHQIHQHQHQPAQYYHQNHTQTPHHAVMIQQQPVFVQQQQQMYQGPPMFLNQQYSVYRPPYQQYVHHPHMLQPNPYYNQIYPQQSQIPAQQLRPQYNMQQVNQCQPPPLIPCTPAAHESQRQPYQTQTTSQMVEEDGPPPLIKDNSAAEGNDVARVNRISVASRPDMPAPSVEQLKYKLSGLQLKQRRLMRERYAQESADFSGAESSSEDENLSTIGTEIDKCKQELEQLLGGAGDNQRTPTIPIIGRGRGKAHLMAILND